MGLHSTWSIRVGASREHDQAVEAKRNAARLRHGGQSGKKILVERITLAVDPLLLRHFPFEAAALLARRR